MNVEIKEQMYEGKAKQVFATSDPEIVMVHYKDDATAGDGEKKGTIRDKGIVNNKLSNALMQKLEKEGIPTHYVEELNDRDTLVKKVQIVPLEVIIRNVAAGHFSLRMGVPEGKVFKTPILEYSYKNDDLHDPFINHYYALALDLATQEELDTIAKYAFKVNEVLKKIMLDANIRLIDFKLEFGPVAGRGWRTRRGRRTATTSACGEWASPSCTACAAPGPFSAELPAGARRNGAVHRSRRAPEPQTARRPG